MTLTTKVTITVPYTTSRPTPRILTVKEARYLTPNMIRVMFSGPELDGFPSESEGGNCKLLIPEISETKDQFVERLCNGSPPIRRTYTVRKFDVVSQSEDRLWLPIEKDINTGFLRRSLVFA